MLAAAVAVPARSTHHALCDGRKLRSLALRLENEALLDRLGCLLGAAAAMGCDERRRQACACCAAAAGGATLTALRPSCAHATSTACAQSLLRSILGAGRAQREGEPEPTVRQVVAAGLQWCFIC